MGGQEKKTGLVDDRVARVSGFIHRGAGGEDEDKTRECFGVFTADSLSRLSCGLILRRMGQVLLSDECTHRTKHVNFMNRICYTSTTSIHTHHHSVKKRNI